MVLVDFHIFISSFSPFDTCDIYETPRDWSLKETRMSAMSIYFSVFGNVVNTVSRGWYVSYKLTLIGWSGLRWNTNQLCFSSLNFKNAKLLIKCKSSFHTSAGDQNIDRIKQKNLSQVQSLSGAYFWYLTYWMSEYRELYLSPSCTEHTLLGETSHKNIPKAKCALWLFNSSSTMPYWVYVADVCANVMQLNKMGTLVPRCVCYVIEQIVNATAVRYWVVDALGRIF